VDLEYSKNVGQDESANFYNKKISQPRPAWPPHANENAYSVISTFSYLFTYLFIYLLDY